MDEDAPVEPDSDEALHSSDEELEHRLKGAERAKISTVHSLLGQREPILPHADTMHLGSLNHSSKRYSDDDDDDSCCQGGCCSRSAAPWWCLTFILVLALALFINVQYHVGPDTSKLLPFLHRSDDQPITSDVSGGGGGLVHSDTEKHRWAHKMQFKQPDTPSPSAIPFPADDPIRIDGPSADTMRQEMQQLAQALDHMHLSADPMLEKKKDGMMDLPDLTHLPDLPEIGVEDTDVPQLTTPSSTDTSTPETQDLEAELHLGTQEEDVLSKMEAERIRLAEERNRKSALDRALDREAQREFAAGLERHHRRIEDDVLRAEERAAELAKEVEEEDRLVKQASHDAGMHSESEESFPSHPNVERDLTTHHADSSADAERAAFANRDLTTHHADDSADAERAAFAANGRRGRRAPPVRGYRFSTPHSYTPPVRRKPVEAWGRNGIITREELSLEDLTEELGELEPSKMLDELDYPLPGEFKEDYVEEALKDDTKNSEHPLLHDENHPPPHEPHRTYNSDTVHHEVPVTDAPSLDDAGGTVLAAPHVSPVNAAAIPVATAPSIPMPPFSFIDRFLFPILRSPVPAAGTGALDPFCVGCIQHCSHVTAAVVARATQLSAEDRATKFVGLSESLSRFFRGTVHLMWESLRRGHNEIHQAFLQKFTSQRVLTWIQGDAHLANVGVVDTTKFDLSTAAANHVASHSLQVLPTGQVHLNLNDFDHSGVSEMYHIDLVRMLISIELTMSEQTVEDSDKPLFTPAQIQEVHRSFLTSYHDSLVSFIGNDLELTHILSLATLDDASPVHHFLSKLSRKRSRKGMLDKFAPIDKKSKERAFDLGRHKFSEASKEDMDAIHSNWEHYLRSLGAVSRSRMQRSEGKKKHAVHHQAFFNAVGETDALNDPNHVLSPTLLAFYRIKSIVRRVDSGLGSLGVKRFFILVEGPSASPDDDLILDMKAQPLPEWWPHIAAASIGATKHSMFASESLRVVSGQESLSPVFQDLHAHEQSDPHLGWIELSSGSYTLRSRSPFKSELPFSSYTAVSDWTSVATSIGSLYAAAHARSDDDYDQRLIPHSFESGFVLMVPESSKADWMNRLIQLAEAESNSRRADYVCWVNHQTGIKEKNISGQPEHVDHPPTPTVAPKEAETEAEEPDEDDEEESTTESHSTAPAAALTVPVIQPNTPPPVIHTTA